MTGWFVRRAGLARCATFACVLGLSLSAVTAARPFIGLAGLMLALAGGMGGLILLSARLSPEIGSRLLIASLLFVGLFAGYLGGSVRVVALTDSSLESLIGTVVEAELLVTGQVRSNGGWQSATAVVRGLTGSSKGPREPSGLKDPAIGETVLLEVAPAEGRSTVVLSQGLIVAFKGKVQAPEGPSASGFDQASQLRHQGIAVVFSADNGGALAVLGRRGGISGWFDRLRSSARTHLSRGPDARLNELLQGVVMGDTVGIDKGWLEAFRRSGTAHMLSVSGLHVASIAAIMIGLARLARASRGVGFILAAAAAVLMIPFVGASPPIIRSSVMIVVVLIGRWVGRGRDQWQVLALAAVVVLALNPFAVFDVGFQLSFAAFTGMLALVGPVQRLLTRLPKAVGSNLAVSVAATLGTAPVSLMVFGKTSLVSPLANLLVVPLLPAVTGLGMASVFLGFAWTGFSTVFDTMASLPMTWTVLVSRLLAVAPVLGVADLGRALFAMGAGVLLLPASLALTGRSVRTPFNMPLPLFKRSAAWLRVHRPRGRRRAAALGIAVLLPGLALGGAAYSPLLRGLEELRTLAPGNGWPDQVEVRVLDVGQGNAVLVRTPEHHTLLFDGGPAGCDLAGQLGELGVRRLDLLVISHPHADHFAGVLESIGRLDVGTLVDQTEVVSRPGPTASSGAKESDEAEARGASGGAEAAQYLELRRKLAGDGCRYVLAGTGSSIRVDGVLVRFFAPSRPLAMVDGAEPWANRPGPPSGEELNGGSLVAVLSLGGVDVLLPGDAEADVLRTYRLPPAEVMLVPHHGSRGAVSDRLLAELGVKVGCISVGADNPFGHPYPATMSALEGKVGTVLRTDVSGWVSCTVNGDAMVITTERIPAR